MFSYPFRPTSLKIFTLPISEQLWNPIDFIITHKKNTVEFLSWLDWERQANRINISHMEHHINDCILNWVITIMIHVQYLHEMAVI